MIGLDWCIKPSEARPRVKGKTLQGNLCPAALYADIDIIKSSVKSMLDDFGSKQRLIANLGHGMEPTMKPEHAGAFIKAIQTYSATMEN